MVGRLFGGLCCDSRGIEPIQLGPSWIVGPPKPEPLGRTRLGEAFLPNPESMDAEVERTTLTADEFDMFYEGIWKRLWSERIAGLLAGEVDRGGSASHGLERALRAPACGRRASGGRSANSGNLPRWGTPSRPGRYTEETWRGGRTTDAAPTLPNLRGSGSFMDPRSVCAGMAKLELAEPDVRTLVEIAKTMGAEDAEGAVAAVCRDFRSQFGARNPTAIR